MKSFLIIRIKNNGMSAHKVWVVSKRAALELVWPDENAVIGKFVLAIA